MYEWDEDKRRGNLAKHRVDFCCMDDFEWDTAVIDPDKDHYEHRWTAVGLIGRKLHVVVFTERNERIRVISLRKATRRESLRHVEDQA